MTLICRLLLSREKGWFVCEKDRFLTTLFCSHAPTPETSFAGSGSCTGYGVPCSMTGRTSRPFTQLVCYECSTSIAVALAALRAGGSVTLNCIRPSVWTVHTFRILYRSTNIKLCSSTHNTKQSNTDACLGLNQDSTPYPRGFCTLPLDHEVFLNAPKLSSAQRKPRFATATVQLFKPFERRSPPFLYLFGAPSRNMYQTHAVISVAFQRFVNRCVDAYSRGSAIYCHI